MPTVFQIPVHIYSIEGTKKNTLEAGAIDGSSSICVLPPISQPKTHPKSINDGPLASFVCSEIHCEVGAKLRRPGVRTMGWYVGSGTSNSAFALLEAYRRTDQVFDPEAEVLSGIEMVYEAFLDKDERPHLTDDADASGFSSSSSSSSSAATEDLEEYERMRRAAGRPQAPESPTLSTIEPPANDFDDFVRVEAPVSDSLTAPPVLHSIPPSSPLRQSVTSTSLDDLPDHPPSDTPEVILQRGDEERLFAYYQSYVAAPPERERVNYGARVVPRVEHRPPVARRVPGNPRFMPPPATSIGLDSQRIPLGNAPAGSTRAVGGRRSASFSEVIASGTRVPERWLAAIDGTVISSHVLAQAQAQR